MIFLETSFIINLTVPKTQNHEKAKKIYKEIEDKPKAISEMVLYETITVLRKLKQDDIKLNEVHDFLVNSIDIQVLEDVIFYDKALELTFNNSLGFFDNLSYIVMKNNDIKTIASFDGDFDTLNDIKRKG